MPAVTVSEKTRKYLDQLRKKAPLEKVPNLKRTVEIALDFIEDNEESFFAWIGDQENRAKRNEKTRKKLKKD